MKIIKEFASFKGKDIEIDGYKYTIKKSKIDLDKFDEDGQCEEYEGKSYVIIDPTNQSDVRVRIFSGIFDENNHRGSFDPLNHSDEIHCRLKHGDECYLEDLHDIISTTNKTGEVFYDYLDDYFIHDGLKKII